MMKDEANKFFLLILVDVFRERDSGRGLFDSEQENSVL
jgi:hypothetical protein